MLPPLGDAGVRVPRIARPHQPDDREDVRDGVDREHGAGVEDDEDQAADHGTDHAREVHLDRRERDGAREVFPRHERRQDRAQARRTERVGDADREHEDRDEGRRGMRGPRDRRERERERTLGDLQRDEQPAPIHPVGEVAADHRQEQQRAELAEVQQPHVEAAVRELQRVRTQQHVLHPRADVRRERPDVDDAEVAVAQRRGRGSPLIGDVAVDEGVLDILEPGPPDDGCMRRHPTDGRVVSLPTGRQYTGAVPMTCSATRRASSASSRPSSPRKTSALCWPSVGAGAVHTRCGPPDRRTGQVG